LPNRDWTPVAAATQFGSSAKPVFVLTKLDGLAWIMQRGRRYDTQRPNRYSEIIRSRDQPEAASDGCLVPDASLSLSGPLYSKFPVRVVRVFSKGTKRAPYYSAERSTSIPATIVSFNIVA